MGDKDMMWASPTRHPGSARMMVALRPCHGGKAAMMWASPTRHPGRARMMVALRPCHGGKAAMINTVKSIIANVPLLFFI
jgi:hypothetical protein